MKYILPARSIVMFGVAGIASVHNVESETMYSLTLDENEIGRFSLHEGFDYCWSFEKYIIYFRKCDLI